MTGKKQASAAPQRRSLVTIITITIIIGDRARPEREGGRVGGRARCARRGCARYVSRHVRNRRAADARIVPGSVTVLLEDAERPRSTLRCFSVYWKRGCVRRRLLSAPRPFRATLGRL